MDGDALLNETLGNATLLPYYLHSPGVALTYVLCYLLVLLLCVGGNSLVCVVVLRNRNMRSVTNLFILNLAVSDLLVGVVCVPVTLIDSLISGWPFSQTTCTLSNLVQGMSVSASVFTLVAIAVDRYTGIMYPFRHRLRPVSAILSIALIWLLALAVISPSAATLTVVPLDHTYVLVAGRHEPLLVCYEAWPRPNMRRVYTAVIFVHVYLAPLVLISAMYGRVAAKLSSTLPPRDSARGGRCRRKVRVIKMLITVAVLFMVSWLPLWTLLLLTDYQELDESQIDFLSSYLFPAAHWLAFFNSGVNPVVYGFFNENFRRAFQAAVVCRPKPGPRPRLVRFRVLASNKVSNDNRRESSRHKDDMATAAGLTPWVPRGRGVLLEELNGLTSAKQTGRAWAE